MFGDLVEQTQLLVERDVYSGFVCSMPINDSHCTQVFITNIYGTISVGLVQVQWTQLYVKLLFVQMFSIDLYQYAGKCMCQ